VKVSTEDELKKLILSNELSFIDARETGIRIQQMKTLEHELELNRKQRLDGLKAQLEAEQHAIEMARTGGDRRQVAREIELKDRKHDVETTKIGGEKRDVELDIATRERMHELAVSRIQADMRTVTRSVEELDTRQRLALKKLEDLQEIEITDVRQSGQRKSIKELQDIELEAERIRLENTIKGGDAEHRRRLEMAQQASAVEIEKIRLLKDGTPEQILAISAGFSPQVANVLIEQAKAKTVAGGDLMAAMREMVQMAKDNNVQNQEQARFLATQATQGATGVAQGVGHAVAGRPPAAAARETPAAPETTECPQCHRVIPVTDRHCRHCGRPMRQ
jgi:hypothetical protein